ncbi:gamma-glutamylcyclotransferase [Candidatus Kaiserbacteria bacterium]|nr:gamma-glutamylcyclotransferase [Candidatus Kaiserbacteria bacterium]
MSINVFGYGSLLNQESRRRAFTELAMVENVVLSGYQRILNAGHDSFDYLAMNLTTNDTMSVKGHVFTVADEELPALIEREAGYDLVNVTDKISVAFDEPVFAFIMHETVCDGKRICERYINTCLGGVPKEEHDTWLSETIGIKNSNEY